MTLTDISWSHRERGYQVIWVLDAEALAVVEEWENMPDAVRQADILNLFGN